MILTLGVTIDVFFKRFGEEKLSHDKKLSKIEEDMLLLKEIDIQYNISTLTFGRTDDLSGSKSYFRSFIYTKNERKLINLVNKTNSCIIKMKTLQYNRPLISKCFQIVFFLFTEVSVNRAIYLLFC